MYFNITLPTRQIWPLEFMMLQNFLSSKVRYGLEQLDPIVTIWVVNLGFVGKTFNPTLSIPIILRCLMLVGQGANTRRHFQTSCYLVSNNTHFRMQSGQGKEGPNNLLRLGAERALSFTGRRATYYVPTYWLANLPFLAGKAGGRERLWRPNPVALPSLCPLYFPLLLFPLFLKLVCMEGEMGKELCAWLPSCTGDGVEWRS